MQDDLNKQRALEKAARASGTQVLLSEPEIKELRKM
jgi:sideroflexin-5